MKEKVLLLSIILMFASSSYGQSGQHGSFTWNISDSILTISGTGAMKDNRFSDYPWLKYNELIKEVVIEDGITNIEKRAFYKCRNLLNANIPNSVTSIGNRAFEMCSSLINIEISDSLTRIEEAAFMGCYNLKDINIPNSVIEIGNFAFSACRNLNTMNIPASIMSIGNGAFWECSGLEIINVDENNTVYKDIDGVVYSKDGEKIIIYPAGRQEMSYTVPDFVISIGVYAFNFAKFTNVQIPNSVTNIEDHAFHNCKNLSSIKIPDFVTVIRESVFDNCENLLHVEIPNSVISIERRAFNGCYYLPSIGLPASLVSIGPHAFNECRYLKKIEIPSGVTDIGEGVFGYAQSLQSITLPNSVTNLGSYFLIYCTSLNTVEVYWREPLEMPTEVSTNLSIGNATLIVPAGTKSLYESANYWKDYKEVIERAPEVPVTSVSVSPKSATLMAGGTLQLNVMVSPSNASIKSVTWLSSNDAVATVDATGKVTAIGGGSATITVTTVDGGKTATFNVTVFEIAVTSVILNTNADSVSIGGSLQLTATINPSYASNKTVTWSSSDEAIATVDSIGNVKGISEGTVVITATSNNGKTASCSVTVYQLMNYVTVEIPIGDTGEWIVFDMERPAGSDEINSFVMGFPEGLEIDPASVILTESLLEGLELSVIPLGYNVWLFEVYLPSTFSAFSTAAKVNMAMNITYRITGDMSYMYEVISCGMNSGFYNMANVPKYELVTKVGLMSGETANGLVNRNNANASIVNGVLTVDSPNDETIKVYSITGIQVYAAEKMEGKVTYQLSNFPDGIYIVTGSKGWSIKILKK